VKLERRAISRLALPLKALVDRFAFAALLAASIGLLIIGRANLELVAMVNTRIADALTPILAVLNEPIDASRRAADAVGHWVALHEDNAQLRAQNERLLEWQSVARQLALENEALRQMLNLGSHPEPPTAVTVRVVADAGGPFVHTVLVDAGRERGVVEGMAAVNAHGLIGRVIEVGRRSARVLLLTDFNSRVPVMVEPSRDQAILAGDNTREPGLIFLPLNPRLSVGDRVVTSGRGGVLPAGLAIGVVSAVRDDKVAVTTWVDWDRLDYLRLLEFAPVRPPEAQPTDRDGLYGPPLPPGFGEGGGFVAGPRP
jgi:rod shape-determining protein MreC